MICELGDGRQGMGINEDCQGRRIGNAWYQIPRIKVRVGFGVRGRVIDEERGRC